MAGIVGFVNTSGDSETLKNMGKLIEHRGPDYEAQYVDEKVHILYKGLNIGYKFEGREKFESDNSVVFITGYIYNEREICAYLSQAGIEVPARYTVAQLISLLYERYGTEYHILLKGSFLITIWDKKIEALVLIKDQFGVQPVFYYQTENGLMFSSELKAFLAHPDFKKEFNSKALRPYLIFQAPATRESFLKGAFKIPEAHNFIYSDRSVRMRQYWDVRFNPEDKPLEEFVNAIEKRVKNSIVEKTNLNQNIGSFLSGGVDSSYLASLLKPDNTFTVGYSVGEFSEIDNAVALSEIIGSENIHEYLEGDECFNKLSEIQYLLDEPSSNPSVVPLYFLSRLAKDAGYNAVISGEGADEFFAGYYEYIVPESMERYKKLPKPLRKFNGFIARQLPTGTKGRNFFMKGGLDTEDFFIGQAKIFSQKEATRLLTSDYKKSPTVKDITAPIYAKVPNYDDLSKKQYLDFHVWMPNDVNLKADRMSMAQSLQIITPLLDNELLEIAEKLPKKYKIQGEKVKFAFRNAALRSLPEEWASRPKLGFPVPIRLWVKDDAYYSEIKQTFTSKEAKQFFNTNELVKLLDEHKQGKKNNQRKIWTVYMFLLWYNEYFVQR